jgi:magnesium transporter
MNFENMPELGLPWAYPAVMILMGLIGVGMIVYFRSLRWL